MDSSASASSSRVVTPGATEVRSSSRVRATTSPASRMRATCSGVLISIRSLRRNTGPSGSEGGEEARGDLVDRAHAVDAPQQALGLVDGGERRGLVRVELL